MRGTLATSGNTRPAADATLPIDKHRLFHPLPPYDLAGRCAFALASENWQLARMGFAFLMVNKMETVVPA
jgi:hypothetical protein